MADTVPIIICVEYTADDHFRARELMLTRVWKQMWWMNGVGYFAMTFGVHLIRLLIEHGFSLTKALARSERIGILFIESFISAVLFAVFMWMSRHLFISFAFPRRVAIQQITFRDAMVQLDGDAAAVTYPWSTWTSALEDEYVLVLTSVRRSTLIIPKRVIPDYATLLRLRMLIAEKVGIINASLAVKTAPPPPPVTPIKQHE